MKQSYNDSGLTAKRSYRLLAAGLTAILMAILGACASQVPLDDAYYRPSSQSTPIIQNTPNTPNTPATPTMQVLHQSDTTITVRIKK